MNKLVFNGDRFVDTSTNEIIRVDVVNGAWYLMNQSTLLVRPVPKMEWTERDLLGYAKKTYGLKLSYL